MNFNEIVSKTADIVNSTVEFIKIVWAQPERSGDVGSGVGGARAARDNPQGEGGVQAYKAFRQPRGGGRGFEKGPRRARAERLLQPRRAEPPRRKNIYAARAPLHERCIEARIRAEPTDATAQIQTALTSAFREHLGVEKLGRIDVRVTGFKGLIYKPTSKFLPPANVDDDSADVLLSSSNPIIDSVDSGAANKEKNSEK